MTTKPSDSDRDHYSRPLTGIPAVNTVANDWWVYAWGLEQRIRTLEEENEELLTTILNMEEGGVSVGDESDPAEWLPLNATARELAKNYHRLPRKGK